MDVCAKCKSPQIRCVLFGSFVYIPVLSLGNDYEPHFRVSRLSNLYILLDKF